MIEPPAFVLLPEHRTDWFGDTRRRRAYRHDDDVATVQFSRAVREGVAGAERTMASARAHGLSQLNSMHPLEMDGMPIWQGQVRSTY